jgi:hypothetical protein
VYALIVFLHVLSAFLFVLSHGASAAVTFQLRAERKFERVAALLEVSSGTLGLMNMSLMLVLVLGIVLGFMGSWWGRGWIWTSLVVLIATSVGMMAVAKPFFNNVRRAAGLEYMEGRTKIQPPPPASFDDLDALLARTPTTPITIIGLGGLALILWLMMFKPF